VLRRLTDDRNLGRTIPEIAVKAVGILGDDGAIVITNSELYDLYRILSVTGRQILLRDVGSEAETRGGAGPDAALHRARHMDPKACRAFGQKRTRHARRVNSRKVAANQSDDLRGGSC
jgi:hypothetical protein